MTGLHRERNSRIGQRDSIYVLSGLDVYIQLTDRAPSIVGEGGAASLGSFSWFNVLFPTTNPQPPTPFLCFFLQLASWNLQLMLLQAFSGFMFLSAQRFLERDLVQDHYGMIKQKSEKRCERHFKEHTPHRKRSPPLERGLRSRAEERFIRHIVSGFLIKNHEMMREHETDEIQFECSSEDLGSRHAEWFIFPTLRVQVLGKARSSLFWCFAPKFFVPTLRVQVLRKERSSLFWCFAPKFFVPTLRVQVLGLSPRTGSRVWQELKEREEPSGVLRPRA